MQPGTCEAQTATEVQQNTRAMAEASGAVELFDLPNSVGECNRASPASRQRRATKDQFDVTLAFQDAVTADTIAQTAAAVNQKIASGQFSVPLVAGGTTFTARVTEAASQGKRTVVVFEPYHSVECSSYHDITVMNCSQTEICDATNKCHHDAMDVLKTCTSSVDKHEIVTTVLQKCKDTPTAKPAPTMFLELVVRVEGCALQSAAEAAANVQVLARDLRTWRASQPRFDLANGRGACRAPPTLSKSADEPADRGRRCTDDAARVIAYGRSEGFAVTGCSDPTTLSYCDDPGVASYCCASCGFGAIGAPSPPPPPPPLAITTTTITTTTTNAEDNFDVTLAFLPAVTDADVLTTVSAVERLIKGGILNVQFTVGNVTKYAVVKDGVTLTKKVGNVTKYAVVKDGVATWWANRTRLETRGGDSAARAPHWVLGAAGGQSCDAACSTQGLWCSPTHHAALADHAAAVAAGFSAAGVSCTNSARNCDQGANCPAWGAPYLHTSHFNNDTRTASPCFHGGASASCAQRPADGHHLRLCACVGGPATGKQVTKITNTLAARVTMQPGTCEAQTATEVQQNTRAMAEASGAVELFDLPNSVGECNRASPASRQRRATKDQFDVTLAFQDAVTADTIAQTAAAVNQKIASGQFSVPLVAGGTTFTARVTEAASQGKRTVVVFEPYHSVECSSYHDITVMNCSQTEICDATNKCHHDAMDVLKTCTSSVDKHEIVTTVLQKCKDTPTAKPAPTMFLELVVRVEGCALQSAAEAAANVQVLARDLRTWRASQPRFDLANGRGACRAPPTLSKSADEPAARGRRCTDDAARVIAYGRSEGFAVTGCSDPTTLSYCDDPGVASYCCASCGFGAIGAPSPPPPPPPLAITTTTITTTTTTTTTNAEDNFDVTLAFLPAVTDADVLTTVSAVERLIKGGILNVQFTVGNVTKYAVVKDGVTLTKKVGNVTKYAVVKDGVATWWANRTRLETRGGDSAARAPHWVLGAAGGQSCDAACSTQGLWCSPTHHAALANHTAAVAAGFSAAGVTCTNSARNCDQGANCPAWGAPYLHTSGFNNDTRTASPCFHGGASASCSQRPADGHHLRLCACVGGPATGKQVNTTVAPPKPFAVPKASAMIATAAGVITTTLALVGAVLA